MIIEEEAYLEHFGKMGMRWGVRNSEAGGGTATTVKAIGRGTVTTAKAIGRGTKATYKWSKAHPKTAISIAAGAAFAIRMLSRHKKTPLSEVRKMPFEARGKGWVIQANDGHTFDVAMKEFTKQRNINGISEEKFAIGLEKLRKMK